MYPGSEIYGGLPLGLRAVGAELRRNIREAWWKRFVHGRDDMVGVETPVIMHPKTWEASGHLQTFTDPLVDCKKCKHRFRADHLLEDKRSEPGYDKERPLDVKDLRCPECGGELTGVREFNLMFKTSVGPTEEASSVAYLRPETAAGMFTAWKNVRDSMRKRLPCGVAQIGKAFRNEITPGNFIFRTREFEQMEIEYFCRPEQAPQAFELWLSEMKGWVSGVLCLKDSNVAYHEIAEAERAFYSARTIDVEYAYPFGVKELYGLANRTDYDLARHQEFSKEDLRYMDPETGEKVLPFVIEPSWGLDRTVLVLLSEHLDIDEAPLRQGSGGQAETSDGDKEPRMVLRLPAALAPVKAAVLPLQKKDELVRTAKDLTSRLRAAGLNVEYDESASIGKRYRRQDEIGTPWCFTVDFDSLNDKKVTVRDRDSMGQERIVIDDVALWIRARLKP